MPSRMRFEDIPGLDPSAIANADELPSGLIVVAARVVGGQAIGAVRADTGAEVVRRRMGQGGPLVHVEGPEYTDVICEPPDYAISRREPYNRTGVTYAGFGFYEANEFALSNGGRLLADKRSYGRNNTAVLSPTASEGPQREGGPSTISRIAGSVEEATLVVAGIGGYMGLSEQDAQLLATVALDFNKVHEGGFPAG